MSARTLAAALFVAMIGTALAQPPKAEPKAEKEKPDIHKLLAKRVTVEKYEGKFKDVVKMLAEKYELPLVLTKSAENWRVCDDGETMAIEAPVKLTHLSNAKVETVLQIVCDQVRIKFLVYPDHIKIAPDGFADYESGFLRVGPDLKGEDVAPFLSSYDLIRTKPLIKRALVNASFKNKPLAEILNEIAESTGANVVISPVLAEQVRQTPLTVRFANTPVDAAVRTLCEMTETGVIEDANVLLVTTRDRAKTREKEDAQKRKEMQPQSEQTFFGAQFDAGEIAKLKEQNEQLKKQLDEIQKLVKKLSEN